MTPTQPTPPPAQEAPFTINANSVWIEIRQGERFVVEFEPDEHGLRESKLACAALNAARKLLAAGYKPQETLEALPEIVRELARSSYGCNLLARLRRDGRAGK